MDKLMQIKSNGFSDCSLSVRLLYSFFLVIMGIAVLLGLVYLYTSHEGYDGTPGLSKKDIVYSYYGNRSATVLESALKGSMVVYISPSEREEITGWIYKGSPEADFQKVIKPLFDRNCITCHNPGSVSHISDLTDYDAVKKLTHTDTGKSAGELARVSHVHLFGIGILAFLVGSIFVRCNLSPVVRSLLISIPFAAIIVDIGSWWLTKWEPFFAYTVIIGGAFTSISIALQILISLYWIWLRK